MKIIIDGKTVELPGGGGGGLPKGSVIFWSGSAEDIPSGWALCDGQDGRPDLRDRFVLGGGGTHPVGELGGEETHTLTEEEMPQHNHSVEATGNLNTGVKHTIIDAEVVARSTTVGGFARTSIGGGSQPHNNMPPYYVLCYIIKVTDGGGGSGGGSAEGIYSTEETRIGTWMGKPLYRKLYQVTSPSVKDTIISVADLSGEPIDKVVNLHGMIFPPNGSCFPVPNVYSNTYRGGIAYGSDKNISVYVSDAAHVSSPMCVVAEYTKASDEKKGGETA